LKKGKRICLTYEEVYALVRFFSSLNSYVSRLKKVPWMLNEQEIKTLGRLNMKLRMFHSTMLLYEFFKDGTGMGVDKKDAWRVAKILAKEHFSKTYGHRA